MPAADPTYPLFPVACILSSALLLLTLATNFIRQSWNLGVTFLCFWLFWENLTNGISAIVWSDNHDVKLYIYCDIVSHLQMIAFVIKPMCTLVITRRLYLIASLRSVDLSSTHEKRKNMIIEWMLGLIIPLIVAGPLYYVVQGVRFVVQEGFGCQNYTDGSILTELLIQSWSVVPPVISIVFYYPKVAWVFYRQHRDTNRFLRSNNSISRTSYFRILALASIDLLFTLPFGISNLVINNIAFSKDYSGHVSIYNGWSLVHSDWAPVGVSYAFLKSSGAANLLQPYFTYWTSPVLSFIIFGLFGLTAEARVTYWGAVCIVGKYFGWKPQKSRGRSVLGTMEFGARSQGISLETELGSRPCFLNSELIVATNPASDDGVDKGIQELQVSKDLDENDSSGSAIDIEHNGDNTCMAASLGEESQV